MTVTLICRAVIVAALSLIACATPVTDAFVGQKILAREKSPFAWITVSEANGKRFISIGSQEQSAVDLTDKRLWVYKYTYLLSLALLAYAPDSTEQPVRCLMIGLGGGSFADFLAETFPHWHIRVVEIDPVVIRFARRFFPLHEKIQIVQGDGRAYLQKSAGKYDIIVMDAFGENFIPAELYTREFFALMKSRLKPKGLLLMNTWENEALDARELATLRSVFARGFYLHHPVERPGNRIYALSDEADSPVLVKKRIAEKFMQYDFPGEAPQSVLAQMQDLHRGVNTAAPITDANVHAVLKNAALH